MIEDVPVQVSSPVPRMRRIDELCDRFEQDWLDGRRPEFDRYLVSVSDAEDRSELFRGLMAVELELRRGEHQLATEADYLRRYPEFHREILEMFLQETPANSADVAFVETPQPVAEAVSSAEAVVMEVVSGPQTGRQFTFDKHDTLLVGRSARAHLQLADDPHFSRFHFRLEVNPPLCYLIDLGSRNGTFVNGEPVRECYLQSGDVISGGMTELRIISNSAEQTRILPSAGVAGAGAALGEAPVRERRGFPAVQPRPPGKPPAEVFAVPAPQPPPMLSPAVHGPVTIPLPQVPAAAATPPNQFGVTIPGYDLQEIIGRGDLGTVFRAVQLANHRSCALKVMTPSVSVGEKALQLFLRECAVLSQLHHPHIVKFLDQGTANGCLYIATEYIPTIKLAEQFQSRSLKERVRVCCGLINQVLAALQYAHNRSLVHRDVKPGNILIARQGQTLAAKLADFGVAKHYSNAGFSQITRAGDVVGSLPYMPPEQFLNSREARPGCDLYAAGATLYQWLTGHTPHHFPPGRSQFLVVLEDAPVPIATRLPEIPPVIAAFVDRALARQPDHRFASADEMRHALKEALQQLR